jgi:hypothetical protein
MDMQPAGGALGGWRVLGYDVNVRLLRLYRQRWYVHVVFPARAGGVPRRFA